MGSASLMVNKVETIVSALKIRMTTGGRLAWIPLTLSVWLIFLWAGFFGQLVLSGQGYVFGHVAVHAVLNHQTNINVSTHIEVARYKVRHFGGSFSDPRIVVITKGLLNAFMSEVPNTLSQGSLL